MDSADCSGPGTRSGGRSAFEVCAEYSEPLAQASSGGRAPQVIQTCGGQLEEGAGLRGTVCEGQEFPPLFHAGMRGGPRGDAKRNPSSVFMAKILEIRVEAAFSLAARDVRLVVVLFFFMLIVATRDRELVENIFVHADEARGQRVFGCICPCRALDGKAHEMRGVL